MHRTQSLALARAFKGLYRLTKCGKQLDHCVQVVGYDTTKTPGYWIVKNSWGKDWGESGYIRIQMGHDLCGIADVATYPLVGPPGPGPKPTPAAPTPMPPAPSPSGATFTISRFEDDPLYEFLVTGDQTEALPSHCSICLHNKTYVLKA